MWWLGLGIQGKRLHRCATRAVKLNSDKIKLRQPKVPFIGHIATSKGLRTDPNKVKVILEMPKPTDVAGVQRLLGMTQYLAKFLPHLSDLTKPLRELTQRGWVAVGRNTRESISTAARGHHHHTGSEVLQCGRRGHYSVRCFPSRTWGSSHAGRPTSGLCISGPNRHRNKVCTDWKGTVSLCLCLQQIWGA